MKKLFLGTALILTACQPAFADEPIIYYPPLSIQVEQVAQEIHDQIIDDFCNQPQPEGKPGTIVISYERNAAGECVVKVRDYRDE